MTDKAGHPRVGVLTQLGRLWVSTVTSMAAMVLLPVLLAAILLSLIGGVGLPLLFAVLKAIHVVANVHRRLAEQALDVDIPEPYLAVTATTVLGRLRQSATDPANQRELGWLALHAVVGVPLSMIPLALWMEAVVCLLAPAIWRFARIEVFVPIDSWTRAVAVVPVGLVSAVLAWWLSPKFLRVQARMDRALLAPNPNAKLVERVEQLATSRAETVDAQAAELRRIERDLHDGAQARLVALGMNLGMVEELLKSDPNLARELVSEARGSTTLALSELRDLVRGIHPPVLADRGLVGGVQALALANPLPVSTELDLPQRLPAPVESAAYFVVAETLTNVAKHSGASRGWVHVRHANGVLRMEIGDDGHGGADADNGTGLAGLRRRLAAFDGVLTIVSPQGGPTLVTVTLPCEPVGGPNSPNAGGAADGQEAG
ncbi:sensor histidine kinase [Solihabitans fulvus]|uniref:histidine kinase n=1 Tax=Solihabitans fulvus TaxID=1892852 RepID=A0A5B2XG90_9PSEU|nr:sensor histidine kinase [Solihabitans fulvus]KAA2262296.1 sensor histidine kinase [Solihabitans fulvus]